MSVHRPRLAHLFLTGAIGIAAACGAAKNSTSSSGTSSPPPSGQGQLAIALVDAPPDKAAEIWVTITRVTAHTTSSGWTTVQMGTAPVTLDLMKLQSPAAAQDLGFVNLPTGTTITQVRLYVDAGVDKNWVVLNDGSKVPLKVPSGSESGIKIHGPWQIAECSKTALTLDFDGKKSIFSHPAKQGTEWILRPVILVKKVETVSTGCSTGGDVLTPCDLANPRCDALFVCTAVGESAVCLGGPGASCTSAWECLNGSCDSTNRCQGGLGGPCSAASGCVVGLCLDDTCQKGAAGAPCDADAQCESGTCSAGSCTGTACQTDDQCPSEWCNAGTCEESAVGKPCVEDCPVSFSLSCFGGVAWPMRAVARPLSARS